MCNQSRRPSQRNALGREILNFSEAKLPYAPPRFALIAGQEISKRKEKLRHDQNLAACQEHCGPLTGKTVSEVTKLPIEVYSSICKETKF